MQPRALVALLRTASLCVGLLGCADASRSVDAGRAPRWSEGAAGVGGAGGDAAQGAAGDTITSGAVDAGSHTEVTGASDALAPSDPPYVPSDCAIVTLEPASQCSDSNDCPVEFAGEAVCPGIGSDPTLAFDGRHLYASLRVSERSGAPTSLLALRIDPQASTHATHVIHEVDRGMLRRDGMETVLLALKGDQLTAHRSDEQFESWNAQAQTVDGELRDAHYDSSGALRLITQLEAMPETLMLDGSVVIEGALAATASVLGDGAIAIAYIKPDANRSTAHARLWSSTTGDHELSAVAWPEVGRAHGPSVALASYALGSEDAAVTWLAAGEISSWGVGFDGAPLARWTPVTTACLGQMTALAPAICPSETMTEAFGEQPVVHAVVADELAGPWLLAQLADTDVRCSWYSSGGCFESQPCNCMQTGNEQSSSPQLLLQSISVQVRSFRFPWVDLPVGALAHTPLSNGMVYVAMSYLQVDDGVTHHHLRYLGIRLAPAAP